MMTSHKTDTRSIHDAYGGIQAHFRIILTAILLLQCSCIGPRADSITTKPDSLLVFSIANTVALFSGMEGFTARIEIQVADNAAAKPNRILTGELSALDGNLLFIPNVKRQQKDIPGKAFDGLSILWNTKSNAAYVLCEPMQAYAPAPEATKSTTSPSFNDALLGNETIDGKHCEKWHVALSDGNVLTNIYTVWRAPSLKNIPLRIQSNTGSSVATLELSKVHFKLLSPALFAVPDSFTRYEQIEPMMAELAARQTSKPAETKGEKVNPEPDGQTKHGGGSK